MATSYGKLIWKLLDCKYILKNMIEFAGKQDQYSNVSTKDRTAFSKNITKLQKELKDIRGMMYDND